MSSPFKGEAPGHRELSQVAGPVRAGPGLEVGRWALAHSAAAPAVGWTWSQSRCRLSRWPGRGGLCCAPRFRSEERVWPGVRAAFRCVDLRGPHSLASPHVKPRSRSCPLIRRKRIRPPAQGGFRELKTKLLICKVDCTVFGQTHTRHQVKTTVFLTSHWASTPTECPLSPHHLVHLSVPERGRRHTDRPGMPDGPRCSGSRPRPLQQLPRLLRHARPPVTSGPHAP